MQTRAQFDLMAYAELFERRNKCGEYMPLTESELFCINSLIFYAALQTQALESVIESLLAEKFGVENHDEITRGNYQLAIDFLLDVNLNLAALN